MISEDRAAFDDALLHQATSLPAPTRRRSSLAARSLSGIFQCILTQVCKGFYESKTCRDSSQVFNCSYSNEWSEKEADRGALASQGVHGRAHGACLLGRRIKVPRQAWVPFPQACLLGPF